MTAPNIHLGYEVGTGRPVSIPLAHLAVTGQTQVSGKTTTLEALAYRAPPRTAVLTFVTKRGEGSFTVGRRVAPYFRDRADWQFVSSIIDATLQEKNKFLRPWIMRVCCTTHTLADVQTEVRKALRTAKGIHQGVYTQLDAYLDLIVPEIARAALAPDLQLRPGLNVMDVTGFTTPMQMLFVRSALDYVNATHSGAIVVIPEAWEFVPEARNSPVKASAIALARKGAAIGNYIWIDSQDMAGVDKTILRSCAVWLIGVQREANEIRRNIANIPGSIAKPKVDDIAHLERGQFFVCYGRHVSKVYVQPHWLDETRARRTAMGDPLIDVKLPDIKAIMEEAVTEEEAAELRKRNAVLARENAELTHRVAELEARIVNAVVEKRAPEALLDGGYPGEQIAMAASALADVPPRSPPDIQLAGPIAIETMYEQIKRRALADKDKRMLALFQTVREIEVTKTVERIKVDYSTQPGIIAALIAEGRFAEPIKPGVVIAELKRRGRSVFPSNVSKDLGRLAIQGFLVRGDGDTYQAVDGMKVRIIEAT